MMGYNTTYGPIRRMRKYLEELDESRGETVRFATDDPRSLAYRLREALVACQEWSQGEPFRDLKGKYSFEEKGDFVVARWKGPEEPSTVTESAPEEMVVNEVENLDGIIGAAMKLGDKADQLRFPNAALMDPQRVKLFNWSEGTEWTFIDQGPGGATLTRREVPDDVRWTPDEEEEANEDATVNE